MTNLYVFSACSGFLTIPKSPFLKRRTQRQRITTASSASDPIPRLFRKSQLTTATKRF